MKTKQYNRQYKILQEMQNAGFNVVTCGNCGDVILLNQKMLDKEVIKCPHCEVKMEHCHLPDLYPAPDKLRLTIKKDRFFDWYFNYGQDQENQEVRMDLANSIIDQIIKVGHGSMSIQELFDGSNHEAIRAYYTER